jgi:hypothetical protein
MRCFYAKVQIAKCPNSRIMLGYVESQRICQTHIFMSAARITTAFIEVSARYSEIICYFKMNELFV